MGDFSDWFSDEPGYIQQSSGDAGASSFGAPATQPQTPNQYWKAPTTESFEQDVARAGGSTSTPPGYVTAAGGDAAAGAAPSMFSRAGTWLGDTASGFARRTLPAMMTAGSLEGSYAAAKTPSEDFDALYNPGSKSASGDLAARTTGTLVDSAQGALGLGVYNWADRLNNLFHGYGWNPTPSTHSDIQLTPDQPKDASGHYIYPTPSDNYVMRDQENAGLPAGPQQAAPANSPDGKITGISALGHHIDQAMLQAKHDPDGSEANAQQFEQHTGMSVDEGFRQLMQRLNQPPDLDLSRAEKGNLLMRFGLGMMAAASRPNAHFFGALAEGGQEAMGGYDQLRQGKVAAYQHNQEMGQKYLQDYISNRRADISDKRADERFRYEMAQNHVNQQRADQMWAHQLQQDAEVRRWHDEQAPLLQSREGYYDARAGAVGPDGRRPLRNPSDYIQMARRALGNDADPDDIQAEAQRMMEFDRNGGFGATVSHPTPKGAPPAPTGYHYENRNGQWGLARDQAGM